MADRLLFLDTETTTGWYDEHSITEVVEFGWVLTENGEVVKEGQSFTSSLVPINAYTESLIEISNDMIKDAPSLSDYMPFVIEQTQGAIVIGHNTMYDLRVIEESLERRGHTLTPWYEEFAARPYLDTMHLFNKVVPNAPDKKLKTLISYAGLDPEEKKHRALPDSHFTRAGFYWMWPRLKVMYEVDTVADLVEAWRGNKPRNQLTLI